MDRSIGTVASPRIQDVTTQIRKSHIYYGGSDNTAQHRTASGKSLNYANGATIQNPAIQVVNVLPGDFLYQDTVGLFGVENHYIKFRLDILETTTTYYAETGWEAPKLYTDNSDANGFWEDFERQTLAFTYADNDYEAADVVPYQIPELSDMYVSVELENLKTGNIYVDSWLDTRIYTQDREEHYSDLMYMKPNNFFYVGFHARNTKRLPYNVRVRIGSQILSYDDIEDKRYIMRRI
jgi:hypothetical protein